jgi:hypothetical protein
MRALRGKDLFGQDAHELCLVPDVVVPHKFKVPNFEKYKGSTCPKAHLVMYARKMSTQTSNDKLLIHCFQESSTGEALRWYMDLDRTNVSTFNDLASAFIKQYNYNSYLAPDRDKLRALAQKERESLKSMLRDGESLLPRSVLRLRKKNCVGCSYIPLALSSTRR